MQDPGRKPTRRKLSDLIVEDVKRWIVVEGLQPGDRLPKEREFIDLYGCAKGTVREALKALEVEGLVVMRTGPTGGAYVAEPGVEQATRALRNYLHFQKLDGRQIYQLRKGVEVEAAAAAVGRLTDADFRALEENIALCEGLGFERDGQRELRLAELSFHNRIADACGNPLLRFMVYFISDLLSDLVDLKRTYRPRRVQFGEDNRHYHRELLDAFRREDVEAVRRIMYEHMCSSEHHTVALEAQVSNSFLLESGEHD
ncbi:FadR/GntR family transcriptional regulator [Arhodomonas sp. KWT2]|uniref:FadR/GntR family transcriptional regulator n=1 Tax=Arhodomonas sp. KWT2 TaxID=3344194 RepID=UPI0035C17E99